jgi:hypothetical protein
MTVEKKPKVYSPIQKLAFQFVKEILGREFDWRFDRRWMAEAKRICEPEEGYPISPDMVWGCLRCLQMGMFGFDKQIQSLWLVTYGEPPYITQYADYIAQPPPFYLPDGIRIWESLAGKTAYPDSGKRDILFVPTIP